MQPYSQSLAHTTFAMELQECERASCAQFKKARSKECHCNAHCHVKVFLTEEHGQPTCVKEGIGTTPEGRAVFEGKLRAELNTLSNVTRAYRAYLVKS